MSNPDYVLELVMSVGVKKPIAEIVVKRLHDEGLLLTPSFGDKTVNLICNTFKDAYGTTKTTRYDRYSASRLALKHGADNICQLIVLMAGTASEPFAPVINNVAEFEAKFVSVVNHLKKQGNNMELDSDE